MAAPSVFHDDTAETCDYEIWAYCQPCNRGVVFMCVDGLLSCPICKAPVQWCPTCSDGELYEGAPCSRAEV